MQIELHSVYNDDTGETELLMTVIIDGLNHYAYLEKEKWEQFKECGDAVLNGDTVPFNPLCD